MKYKFETKHGEEIEFLMPTKNTPRMKKAFDQILLDSMKYWDNSMEMPELIISQDDNGNCQEMFEKVIFRNQQANLVDWQEQDFDEVLEVLQGFFFSKTDQKQKSKKFLKNSN